MEKVVIQEEVEDVDGKMKTNPSPPTSAHSTPNPRCDRKVLSASPGRNPLLHS